MKFLRHFLRWPHTLDHLGFLALLGTSDFPGQIDTPPVDAKRLDDRVGCIFEHCHCCGSLAADRRKPKGQHAAPVIVDDFPHNRVTAGVAQLEVGPSKCVDRSGKETGGDARRRAGL